MNEFINTLDSMSEDEAMDAILEGRLTEFADNRFVSMAAYAIANNLIATVNLPLLKEGKNSLGQNPIARAFFPAMTNTGSFMQGCTQLTTVHFPALGNLYNYAFSGCSSLNTLILSSIHVVAKMNHKVALSGTPIESGTGYVYVRKRFLDQYRNATNWSTYASQIRAIEDFPEIEAIVDADLAEMRGEAT